MSTGMFSLQYSKLLQETQLSLTNRATRLEVNQGPQTWYHIRYVTYGFLLLCYSNSVRKTHCFLRYSTSKMPWPWKPG